MKRVSMKLTYGRRKAGLVRRAYVLGVVFMLVVLQPTLGGAAVVTGNYLDTGVTASGPLVVAYDYTAGSTKTWTTQADFDAGSYTSSTGTDVPGSVVLDVKGPAGVAAADPADPWWDTDWNDRRCYTIDHTDAAAITVTEYQLRLAFPLTALVAGGWLQSDYGDLRAIGSDGTTSLPLWVDDTEPDVVWVQIDTIAAGSTGDVCLYYGYGAGTATSPANHTESAVFGYTTPHPIYYAVSDRYASPGTSVDVVTYTDGNMVTRDGTTTVSLTAAGDRGTFDAADTAPGSVFSVFGPIAAGGTAAGFDTLVPISYSGTTFIVPTSRGGQQFSFYAPFGDAAVELFDGATSVASFTVPAGTVVTDTADDITAGNTALIQSDVPILVTHVSDVGGDSLALYPATTTDLFGVRSSTVLIGYGSDGTTVTVANSDGTTATVTGDRGGISSSAGGAAAGGGAGDGVQLTADQPIAAINQDDGDGDESVTFLPRTELNARYWVPEDSQYVAFSCPTVAATPIDIAITPDAGPARPVSCTGGPDVAWASDTADLAVTATRGTEIASSAGEPFFAYYETLGNDAETNLLGMKQGRQYTWPEPVVTAGGDEGLYESTGTWESDTFDTGVAGVFGIIRLAADEPTGTGVRLQIATATGATPTAFHGPDGTAGTFYAVDDLPEAVDFSHDGDQLVRIRAELTTTDPAGVTPRLDSAGFDYDLPRLAGSLGTTPAIGVTTTTTPATSYLLRLEATGTPLAGSTAALVHNSDTNLVNLDVATFRFVNVASGLDSVQDSLTGPADPPVSFDATQPHSVVLDHAALAPGITRIDLTWQLDYAGTASVFAETDFSVEVTAP
jgi:hypothetical protein